PGLGGRRVRGGVFAGVFDGDGEQGRDLRVRRRRIDVPTQRIINHDICDVEPVEVARRGSMIDDQ
ncbi:MAG TPA: hypothetical protein VGA18_01435, partial [Rhodothermales bacterium]